MTRFCGQVMGQLHDGLYFLNIACGRLYTCCSTTVNTTYRSSTKLWNLQNIVPVPTCPINMRWRPYK